LRRVHRPVRIVENLAPHRDQIGLPIAQDLLGLVAMDDQADGHGHDAGVLAHIFRQRHLITVFYLFTQDRCHIGDAARRTVDDIDALGFQDCCKPRALLRAPAGVVFYRQAYE
jgi:hypothetical protein